MLDAVAKYLIEFANVDEQELRQGYQNHMALPAGDTYTIISYSSTDRVGTNVSRYSKTDDEIYLHALREYTIDVDVCDTDEIKAHNKAKIIEIVGRSSIGVKFFEELNLCLDYAEDIQYIPFVDEREQYIHRYRIALHITQWEKVTLPQEYAERVELQRLENIDAHHKP